ncbi:hypothetical protein [Mesorhizobium zhangyense]|nr:hypothetical protein [Mesorhizobium zhangyense]
MTARTVVIAADEGVAKHPIDLTCRFLARRRTMWRQERFVPQG